MGHYDQPTTEEVLERVVKDRDQLAKKIEELSSRICQTCKYWGKDEISCCGKVNDADSLVDIFVRVNDDHGLRSVLRTEPHYGCNQWKRK